MIVKCFGCTKIHKALYKCIIHSFIHSFIHSVIHSYQLLQEALIKEFANPDFEQGLMAALETRQGHLKPATVDPDEHTSELAMNLTWSYNLTLKHSS